MFYEFTQSLVSGLLIGLVFALLGVGFSLTWGITKVINIAHAAVAVLAAYLAYWATTAFGLDPLLMLIPIVPLFFGIGVAVDAVLIAPTARRARELTGASMVLTFGLAAVIENATSAVWSPDPRVLNSIYTGKALAIGDIALPVPQLVAAVLSIVTLAILFGFLHYSYVGRAVTAVWQDRHGAALAGINLRRVTSITYGVAFAAAGVGGVAMSLVYTFTPATQFSWLIYIFLVVIFGGVGSVLGVGLAGLFIGLVIGVAGVFVPFAWVNLVLFVLLIILLLIRPKGLMQI
jgi:branched-chain amino acid transport system permease protein